METITETIITESTMIGHNPSTPGGVGIGVGLSILIDEILLQDKTEDYIVVVPNQISFEKAAEIINKAEKDGYDRPDQQKSAVRPGHDPIHVPYHGHHRDRVQYGVDIVQQTQRHGKAVELFLHRLCFDLLFLLPRHEKLPLRDRISASV